MLRGLGSKITDFIDRAMILNRSRPLQTRTGRVSLKMFLGTLIREESPSFGSWKRIIVCVRY